MLVKLHRPPPEMRILRRAVRVVFEQEDAAVALAGDSGAHETSGASTDARSHRIGVVGRALFHCRRASWTESDARDI